MKVRLFPSGALGGDLPVVSALQGGTVEMTILVTSLLAGVVKDFTLLDAPFLFNAEREADAVLDGPVGQQLLGKLSEKGIVGLGYFEYGFRHFTNSRRPVEKVEDLQGLKIRVTPDKVRLETFEALGAQPAPLAFGELYSAFQQGVFDAQENPLAVIESSSFFDVQKYVSKTEHVWGAAALVLSKPVWDKLTPDDQKVIRQAAKDSVVKMRELWAAREKSSEEKVRAGGVKVITVNKDEFSAAMKPVYDKFVTDAKMKSLLEEIQAVN